MKKILLPVAAALLWVAPASADELVRTLDKQLSAQNSAGISLDFPVGELIVEGTTGRQVQVQVELECDSMRKSRCVEATKGIEVISTVSADRLRVGLKGWPKSGTRGMEATFRVSVPRDLPLRVDLGVGEIRISGVENDLDVDLGVGEANITMPESAVASVSVDTGVGESNLSAQGQRWESSGFISKELDWRKGSGKAKVRVDLGVGEASVKLK